MLDSCDMRDNNLLPRGAAQPATNFWGPLLGPGAQQAWSHRDDPGFGYRFIADELTDAGHDVSERRVWKLCSQARIVSAHSRKRGRFKKPGPPVHDDLVERDFTAPGPNRLWLTDITEHPTAEGKLYLCAVKDVWSRRIVGYSIDSRMTSHLAVDALEMAIARRGRDQVPGAWSTPTGAPSSAPGPTSPPCTGTGCAGRWAESRPPRTTPPWSPSSPCSRRTS